MADLLLQNSKGKTWCEPSLSFGMQTGTVKGLFEKLASVLKER